MCKYCSSKNKCAECNARKTQLFNSLNHGGPASREDKYDKSSNKKNNNHLKQNTKTHTKTNTKTNTKTHKTLNISEYNYRIYSTRDAWDFDIPMM